MNIGNVIKKRRKNLNISQEELANRLNVSRSAISNWEIGRNYPDIQTLLYLSDELNISLDQLLKSDTAMTNSLQLIPTKKRTYHLIIFSLIGLLFIGTVISIATRPQQHPNIHFQKFAPTPEGTNATPMHLLTKEDIQDIRFTSDNIMEVQFRTNNETGVGAYMTGGDLISIYKNDTDTNEKELLTFDAVVKIDLKKYGTIPTDLNIEVQ